MSEREPVITLENVSVCYRVPRERLSGIKEYTIRWLQRRLKFDDFWALDDISFQVMKGEIFGVIGLNGAGKSTMLKVMARVLQPTLGRVIMIGEVAPLLELGGAFHPELTGRENIFLNSALLGRPRRETEATFNSIVDFSDIGEFIDAPIRTYSTGMLSRLGFSIATSIRPDILLVDEVLSVGDSPFQRKCLDRMYTFQDQGTTIVIVSHSMSTLEGFCDRAVWLHNGKINSIGHAGEVAKQYIMMGRDIGEDIVEKTYFEEVPVLEMSTPQAQPLAGDNRDYVLLPEIEHIYPAAKYLNIREGSATFQLKFLNEQPQRTAILFHSDDSRYVIYSDVDPDSSPEVPIRRITARAVGNRKALDPFYGTACFPEVVVQFDDDSGFDFVWNEWHRVTMTWSGYPIGTMALYIDDILAGEYEYTPHHDNQYRLAIQIAVGIRPREWVGELIERADGTVAELHPQVTNNITGSGKEIRDFRLYRKALTIEEISAILEEPSHSNA